MQDVFSKLGPLIIASRLKRMSDYIMRAGAEFYRSNGIEFEPKWFPLYYLLSQEKELGIMDIAQKLNISHPAVIQLGKELEKNGWVIQESAPLLVQIRNGQLDFTTVRFSVNDRELRDGYPSRSSQSLSRNYSEAASAFMRASVSAASAAP